MTKIFKVVAHVAVVLFAGFGLFIILREVWLEAALRNNPYDPFWPEIPHGTGENHTLLIGSEIFYFALLLFCFSVSAWCVRYLRRTHDTK